MDLHRYTFVLDDNPALTADYVERIKRSYTGMWRKRYIEAEWVVAEGSVYSMFESHRSMWWTNEDLPRLTRMFSVGIDLGTTNPTVSRRARNGRRRHPLRRGRMRIEDGRSDGIMSSRLRTWLRGLPTRPEWIIIDPAAASFKVQVAEDGIINVMNGENDVLYGIRAVHRRSWKRAPAQGV